MTVATLMQCLLVLACSFARAFSLHPQPPPSQPISGILNVYKPRGMTSNDACQIVKRILLERLKQTNPTSKVPKIRVGHGGTLDKHAEGVLAIGIGQATKLLHSYLKGDKCYEAVGVLGYETDTLDVHGQRLKEAPWQHVTETAFDAAIQSMHGAYDQFPPLYSAKKYNGRRLRDYARKNLPVEIKPSRVMIRRIERLEVPGKELPHFALRVTSSGGTYVRSLIRDIARKVNTLGTMVSLVRISKCHLSAADSLPLAGLDYETITQNLS